MQKPYYLVDDGKGGFEIDPAQFARSPLCEICAGSGRLDLVKLTDEDKRRIRLAYQNGGKGSHAKVNGRNSVTLPELAGKYGVSESTIRKIVKSI